MVVNPSDRPWYGSSQIGEFRLRPTDTRADEIRLLKRCEQLATNPPVDEYRGLRLYDAGWEWSVFHHGEHVFKIPAGRFPEISDPRYLHNASLNHQKILAYLDPGFVAKTEFHPGFIQQEFVESRLTDVLDIRAIGPKLRKNLQRFFSQLDSLLNRERWLPDIQFETKGHGLLMRNWVIDLRGVPKLFDFTSYCDPFRLQEQQMNLAVAACANQLAHVQTWLQTEISIDTPDRHAR